MAKPAYNGMDVFVKCLPAGKFDLGYHLLITIIKYPQAHKTEYIFSFRDFFESREADLGKLHQDTLMLNGSRLTDYYVITESSLGDAAHSSIECLYWTERSGLVAYKYRNGVCWVRTSRIK
ncbi:hypothetical protein Q4E93_19180 [Flavitalea sp. BT771]|uniref:hypothetical protein n=1 Tax=Flavitalea sp. BT771 TaxID=3063329 RepID=UPI0026E35784|nr:hypothetical protein [Flavitalea sp. BT771]MDO6432738.1 hypothetical protein [Flavitalea sp. BT771]MDV6221986.1 hypothetical protein [Flavitalea sp. BT771]